MSVLSKEEYLARISTMIGEDNSDEAIAFMEDLSDTYADLESKVVGDGVDWKAKYEENDTAWRTKYKERFSSGEVEHEEQDEFEEHDKDVPKTFDDLFTVKENN